MFDSMPVSTKCGQAVAHLGSTIFRRRADHLILEVRPWHQMVWFNKKVMGMLINAV